MKRQARLAAVSDSPRTHIHIAADEIMHIFNVDLRLAAHGPRIRCHCSEDSWPSLHMSIRLGALETIHLLRLRAAASPPTERVRSFVSILLAMMIKPYKVTIQPEQTMSRLHKHICEDKLSQYKNRPRSTSIAGRSEPDEDV
jgi:hypothetical protein